MQSHSIPDRPWSKAGTNCLFVQSTRPRTPNNPCSHTASRTDLGARQGQTVCLCRVLGQEPQTTHAVTQHPGPTLEQIGTNCLFVQSTRSRTPNNPCSHTASRTDLGARQGQTVCLCRVLGQEPQTTHAVTQHPGPTLEQGRDKLSVCAEY